MKGFTLPGGLVRSPRNKAGMVGEGGDDLRKVNDVKQEQEFS